MIGQQKRPLEHLVSSQPVKYQKHRDDNLCESNTRVGSLNAEYLEFQQHFSEVVQRSVSSISPGASCDSIDVYGNEPAPESRNISQDFVPLEREAGAQWGSYKGGVLCKESVDALDGPYLQTLKEFMTEDHLVGLMHSKATSRENLVEEQSMDLFANMDTDEHSSVGVAQQDDCKSTCLLGSTSSDFALRTCRHKLTVLQQVYEGSSAQQACEDRGESNPLLETVQTTVDLVSKNSGPLPVLVSEAICDLNLMHERVQSFGGYETVTSEGKWGAISEALGLGSDFGPGLKLVDFNYLRSLERKKSFLVECESDIAQKVSPDLRLSRCWNQSRLIDEKDENYFVVVGELYAESETFPGTSAIRALRSSSSSLRRHVQLETEAKTQKWFMRQERELANSNVHCRAHGDHGSRRNLGDPSFHGNCGLPEQCNDFPCPGKLLRGLRDNSTTASVMHGRNTTNSTGNHAVANEGTLERDQKSLADTVTWIKRMALDPGNPYMGQGPDGTGQNEHWVSECASQAWRVRSLLWRRRDMRPGDGHLNQLKQTVTPPAVYYEELPLHEHHSIEKLRASRERFVYHGSPSASEALHESEHFQRASSSLAQPQWVGQSSHRLPRQSHFYHDERYSEDPHERPRKRIPVGPDFQACLSVWRSVEHSSSVGGSGRTGLSGDETQSSDDEDDDNNRFLGNQVWPPPGSKRTVCRNQLGKGRPLYCSCADPKSLNCVRLHILGERDRLKQELGQAFYVWKFDQMGESVTDNWTKDEEQTFRTLVMMNPRSQEKNFWDQLPKAYPVKKPTELVSYYFNVFVFRRRAIQNRLDPHCIDSDDDETELPEGVTDESDNYESGDELDDEAYEDASEEGDGRDKQDCLYEDDTSAKLLDYSGFCSFDAVNMVSSSNGDFGTTPDKSEGEPKRSSNFSRATLEDSQQRHHNQQAERGGRHTRHATARGDHENHDDEKHLEELISIVREEDLQEVKSWEVSHWDEGDPEELVGDPISRITGQNGGEHITLPTERSRSPLKKEMDENSQLTTMGSVDGEVWGPTMDIVPMKGRDKLLSTNGMIQEFFGDEASGQSSLS